jgi:hypothetical protein
MLQKRNYEVYHEWVESEESDVEVKTKLFKQEAGLSFFENKGIE